MGAYKITEVDKAYIVSYWASHYDAEKGPKAWPNKMLTRELAQKFNVSTDTIWDIIKGRSWRDDAKKIRHNVGSVELTESKTHVAPPVYRG